MALALIRRPSGGLGRRAAAVVAAVAGALVFLTAAARGQESVPDAEPDWTALAAERLPQLQPCQRPNIEETLLCGTLEVAEDRQATGGRRITLSLVVVPALTQQPPSDAVFVFEGGPGGAATKRAAGSVWSGPVRQRDIVLVDQRGTGNSHSIDCDLGGSAGDEPGELSEMFPPQDVRECAERLSQQADLRQYTSAQHADDIEQVRLHLGYGQINLRGGSYGTAAMMTYAQRYPESTRTLFGIGWNSPLRTNLAERGVMTERALTRLTVLCDDQPACGGLVPGLGYRIAELLERLDESPLTVELSDPHQPTQTLSIVVTHDWMAEMLRLNLYFAFTSRALPWAVHRAQLDDWGPLTEMALLIERSFRSTVSYGVLLTVQCSEFMDFDIEAAMARGEMTLFGNYRLEQQLQGCAEWPYERQPRLGVARAKVMQAPTLLLSGYLDPVTPPDYAEEARQIFPNSRHVVLPGAGHGPFDLENSWTCVHEMWADLLEHADPGEIDISCTELMTRPPFIVEGEMFRNYVDDVLAPEAL